MKLFCLFCILFAIETFAAFANSQSTGNLVVTYGPQGIERVSYAGNVLLDAIRWPDDTFHIWHISASDLSGKDLTKKLGWGENNKGRRWDATTKSWIYSFEWGEIRTQYKQQGNDLSVVVTASNRAGSGVIFEGATIYPLTIHSIETGTPAAAAGAHWTDGINEPAILASKIQGGQLVFSSNEAKSAIWLGMEPSTSAKSISTAAVVSTTLPDGLRDGGNRLNRIAVGPGQTASTSITLRFLPAGVDPSHAALETLLLFHNKWPERLNFSDRRLIGTVYLASAGSGEKSRGSGTPSNPRRFLAASDVDLRSATGLERFQSGILGQAETIVQNLHRMGGQGAITWDVEGQEYPPDTSYVCSPDQIAAIAPEMETVVTSRSGSKYAGMKLDDAYFRTIRDAGFRVGVCVRPQHFALKPDGSATQVALPDGQAVQELIRKMKYAHERWGATLFYLDSTVRLDKSSFTSEMLEAAAAAMPDSLLIPEEGTTRSFRAMAPFATFLFHGDLGTSNQVRAIYPKAFSVNLINDVDPVQLLIHHKELVDEVRKGDVLMIHADYWQANDDAVKQIYQEAKHPR